MKRINLFILIAAAAMLFAACGAPAENKPANTNTNTAKPTAAAPTVDALFAMDKQANDAWIKGDKAFFEGFLSDKFVSFDGGKRMSRAELLSMIGSFKCDMKTWNLDDPQMAKINDDTYVVSYKGTFDGTCTGPDGKAEKMPSPMRAASVYVREGDKWKGAFHSETPIIEPKSAADDKKDGMKKDMAKKEEPKKDEPKKAEMKKDEPKKDDVAKGEAKKDDAMKDDKAAHNSNAALTTAKASPDANTDALVKLHTGGWEAWKAKDAKKLEELSSTNLAIVNPAGIWMSGRDAIVKAWTEMKCEGVNNVKVSDGFASALSPTVELLSLTGTADGTCDGQKNGPLQQTAIYVKEGDAWKLAFMFEAPKM